MKKLLWILLILGVCTPMAASAAMLFQEDFNYTTGTLITANGWTAHSGTGTNAITVVTPGLSYAGYPMGVGNAAGMTTSGEDDNKTFASQTAGSVYYAFLVKFTAAQTGDYFIHFGQNPFNNNFYARLWAKTLSGGVALAINRGSSTASTTYTASSYALNTTHLLVVKYTFVAGATNDTADLWVDPTISGTEPSPTISNTDVASADAASIGAMALRQGSAAAAPTQVVDGIRAGTTWAEVVAGLVPGACCAVDGTCAIGYQADCISPSVWHGEWTSCTPNNCPQPQGACCETATGNCTLTTQLACSFTWHGEWTVCDPNPCPQPPAACCHTDGTCSYVPQAQCADNWLGLGTVCDPNPCLQPLGACCAPDGSCTQTTVETCLTPSVWHSEWTNCTPDPCPQPPGACCAPDGSCTYVLAAECQTTWLGFGSVCDPNPCPQPTAACCQITGVCTMELAVNCTGTWLGYPATCTPNPCPQPGACCLSNGDCTVVLEAACQGTWKGPGVACSPYPCPPIPLTICQVRQQDVNGVPLYLNKTVILDGVATVAMGAFGPSFAITADGCCTYVYGTFTGYPTIAIGDQVHVTGTVTQFYGATEISNPNLNYSVGSSGNPVPTPAVVTTGELAANGEAYEGCIVRLSCVHLVSGTWPPTGSPNTSIYVDDGSGQVQVYIYATTGIPGTPQPLGNFDLVGMMWQHDSTAPYFEGYELEPRSVNDIYWGACCLHNGTCLLKCPAECDAVNGIFHNDWKSCVPNPCPMPTGACCSTLGLCSLTTAADCVAPSTWLGADTVCDPNPCQQPSGACCHPDGSCTQVLEPQCVTPNVWQGPNTSCGERNPCPQAMGACCAPTGACELRLEVDCLAPNTWRGPLTTCDPNLCPQPTGACCNPSTGACQMTLQTECQTPFIWHPEWASCDPNNCPIPMGACCEVTGGCNSTTQIQCFPPRVWLAGEPCSPNPCQQPTGACCGTDGSCVISTEASCVAPSFWHGEWSACTPNNPCPQPQPQGACCTPAGACTVLEHGDCYPPSIWHPEWLACDPNPCPLPPVERACCTPAGACTITIETACVAPNVWHADWASCTPSQCPLPVVGACCVNYVCSMMTAADCANAQGIFKGAGVECTPTLCGVPPTPVQRSTWGQIKNKYR